MMLSEQAAQIAEVIKGVCDVEIVYPSPPARVEMFTAVVSPAPEWGSFEGATFCGPNVNWEVILLAGLTDFAASMDWFYARVTEMAASPELGVRSWSQPERISTGSADALAVRVQLSPRTLEDS